MDTPSYLHGFGPEEHRRLRRQARIVEQRVHADVDLQGMRRILELGCGVGAQTEVLLRRWPDLSILAVDRNRKSLGAARDLLEDIGGSCKDRWQLMQCDAANLSLAPDTLDGAWLCWILEHVPDPEQVLREVRRVLRPEAEVIVSEVQNASLFLSPESPATSAYWDAFNQHQRDLGGDPYVGARLGNLLKAAGYQQIRTEVRPVLLDSRDEQERAEFLDYWTDLLLSGAPGLLESGRVEEDLVEAMKQELCQVGQDQNAVFFYAFVQARARVG